MADKIIMQNMVFYGHHGVFAPERELGQKFVVDLEMDCDLGPAGLADDLDLTVNYVAVYQAIRDIVEKERFQLLEALAEKVAARVLAAFPVEKVMVRVKKPWAPIGGMLDYVAVEILRPKGAEG